MLGLRFKKMSIRATVLHQGLGGATFDNSPLLDHVDAVSHLDGGQTVTDEDGGLILEQLAEFFKDLGFCLGVHSAVGFVEYNDLRVAKGGTCQGNFLPLTDAEFFSTFEALTEMSPCCESESHTLQGHYPRFLESGHV